MIDEQGGVPTLEGFARAMYGWLGLWLRLLQEAQDQPRLYEASAIALSILDPEQSQAERQWVAEALARHAGSADHLGLVEEALQYYQRAIPLLEEFDSEKPVHMLLDHAISRVLTLQHTLRNEEEARIAAYRAIDRFKGTKNPVWRLSVANARVVLGLRGFGRSDRRDPPS